MATINLGSIKFNWKGTYGGGTPYVVDDVVEYNGSSYICILASTGNLPTNATYFEQMSSAGTDGTDLTTTLTTQGDILYRDGSGLQRLGAGTSGQALITGGTGANPSWGSAGGIKQVIQGTVESDFQVVNAAQNTFYFPTTNKLTATITPSSASSKILVQILATVHFRNAGSDMGAMLLLKESISGGTTTTYHPNLHESAVKVYVGGLYFSGSISTNARVRLNEFQLLSPNTTSSITYEVGAAQYAAGADMILFDDNSQGRILLTEVTV